MRAVLSLLLLLFLARPDMSFARIELDNRLGIENAAKRAFLSRLKDELVRTEKRIQAIFGMKPDGTAVVVDSDESFDFKLAGSEPSSPARKTVVINRRIVQSYPMEDLRIAVARNLYLMVWPKFRKPFSAENMLVGRLYVEGMTAYATELLNPGSSRWKYAGLYGNEGSGLYQQYLSLEKNLAEEVLLALSSEAGRELANCFLLQPQTGSSSPALSACRLLSYRIMKTFEKERDPKMIQLMDFTEFRERLPRGLDSLIRGFSQR